MRVAIRRMRVGLSILNIHNDHELVKPILKGLRKTGNALGKVRDRDVFWDNFEKHSIESNTPQIINNSALKSSFQRIYIPARKGLQKYLSSKKYYRFATSIYQYLTEGAAPRHTDEDIEGSTHLVEGFFPQILNQQTDRLAVHFPHNDNLTYKEVHRIRIDIRFHQRRRPVTM